MNIQNNIQSILSSEDYTCDLLIGKPMDEEMLLSASKQFKMLTGIDLPYVFNEFFAKHDGFRFRWTYKKLTHPDYITGGGFEIFSFDKIIEQLKQNKKKIVFDLMNDINYSVFAVRTNKVILFYYDKYDKKYYPMKLDVGSYFDLLQKTKGLYPWQEFFINSSVNRPVSPLKEKFYVDLKLICPDSEINEIKTLIANKN